MDNTDVHTVNMMRPSIVVLAALGAAFCILPATPAAASLLSGVIFVDNDMNGEWDRHDEWVLPGVRMRLTVQGNPNVSVEIFSDQYGRFQFDDLAAGVYNIEQVQLLPEYISVTIDVGTLVNMNSGTPLGSGYGVPRQYSQSQGIMPAVVSIEIPNNATGGLGYDFGQIWWGKFMYLGNPPGNPPHAVPPPEILIPEPSAAVLLLAGAVCLLRRRRSPPRLSSNRL